LDAELKWYAQALGTLRDGQVLRAHLDEQLAELAPELVLGPVAARIAEAIDTDVARARAELGELLNGARYQALLRELSAWQEELPLVSYPPAGAVRDYLRRAERKVRKRLGAAARRPAGPDRDTAMHRARKAAKRARYTAELAEPLLGRKAARIVARNKKLQNALGERQDGVVAAEFLRRLGAAAGSTAGENGFTFGLLFEQERNRTRAADRAAIAMS
jgi:CHAD domain-containing protein